MYWGWADLGYSYKKTFSSSYYLQTCDNLDFCWPLNFPFINKVPWRGTQENKISTHTCSSLKRIWLHLFWCNLRNEIQTLSEMFVLCVDLIQSKLYRICYCCCCSSWRCVICFQWFPFHKPEVTTLAYLPTRFDV